MKQRIGIALLLLLLLAVEAMADGKMFGKYYGYGREVVPPKIPYQRALILFRDGTETLILQSRYEIPAGDSTSVLGWVVPVPAPPEVASLDAGAARSIFGSLSWRTQPVVLPITIMLLTALCRVIFAASLLTLILCALYRPECLRHKFKARQGFYTRLFLYGLCFCLLASCLLLLSSLGAAGGSHAVDVIAEHRVGVYDVRVVRSEDTGDLIAWLNDNELAYGDQDKAAFDSYISRGWCFVVAHIRPTPEQRQEVIVSEGLAAPLILRFPHADPVYPLALTGTGGHDTEILIYLVADKKMTCDDRLALRFAGGEFSLGAFSAYWSKVDPKGFFGPDDLSLSYLCKFKNILTAKDMAQDLVFQPAGDSEDYREHVWKW